MYFREHKKSTTRLTSERRLNCELLTTNIITLISEHVCRGLKTTWFADFLLKTTNGSLCNLLIVTFHNCGLIAINCTALVMVVSSPILLLELGFNFRLT